MHASEDASDEYPAAANRWAGGGPGGCGGGGVLLRFCDDEDGGGAGAFGPSDAGDAFKPDAFESFDAVFIAGAFGDAGGTGAFGPSDAGDDCFCGTGFLNNKTFGSREWEASQCTHPGDC